TDYVLKIVVRVTIDDISLDSEALEISFRTLEELPEPTENQIRWTATETTLTVDWDNAATGVTSYDLTLTRTDGATDTVVGGPIEVDARTTGSTTFTSLDAETTYTLSVVAKGDTSLYAPSPEYRVTVETNAPGQLSAPIVTLSIQSSRNIVVSWDGVTNATTYALNLYSSSGERIGEVEETAALVYTFEGLDLDLKFGTEYTVGVIAQSQDFPNSREARQKIMTERFVLSAPSNEIMLTAGPKTVTVEWSTAPAEVTAYLLSIAPDPAGDGEQTIEVSANEYPFENLMPDTIYTVSVISSRDETGFVQSSVYTTNTRTQALPQLATVELGEASATTNSLSLSWTAVTDATTYTVNLYPGDGTSASVESSMVVTATMHTFTDLVFGSPYTLEVIAKADGYRDSDSATREAATLKRQLLAPRDAEIDITVTAESITVSWNNLPSEVENYVINIIPAGPNQERT
ncbi:MAG: fibronectin type III domain-containing protein, partial [Candidatus Oxydemutatoraceae bacterium WSBS_2016_MAG_OTU14]